MSLTIGDTFAGYRVLRLLGSGGIGEVYLVQHPRLPRQEALKVLRREFSEDESFRERFTREADLASRLRHPHIVGIHDRGEHDGQLWIAMDYIDGADLSHLLERRYPAGVPVGHVLPIVTAVASALDHAHKRGLLHRDVKPANIIGADLDTYDPKICLADFGIARPLGDISGITTTNMTVGTVAYAAPEQLMGDQMDGRADQYALAATTYHLLTGSQLFPNSNPAVVISRHLTSPPPALAEARGDLVGLESALARALSKSPTKRFDSCADFATALIEDTASDVRASSSATTLAASVAAEPSHRGGPTLQILGAPHPQRRMAPRRAIVAAVGGVVLIAGASLLAVYPWGAGESDTAATSSSVATAESTSESVQPTPPTTPVTSPAPPPAITTLPEPAPVSKTALPLCYSGNDIAAKPSSGGLLCKGHWLENLTWTHWGADAADGRGIEAIKGCTPSCATGELSRYPVEVYFSAPEPAPSSEPRCPSDVRFYTQLIVAYPTSQPPPYSQYEGGPIAEIYNGMPSLRWNGLSPYCF